MKKIIILASVLIIGTVVSCQQDDYEEMTYSCNKRLNQWAHENINDISLMDRQAWLKLSEEYKKPAFNAFTPEQKLLFWKNKLEEVLKTFTWNKNEIAHILKLYAYLDEHPNMYEEEIMNDSLEHERFARFAYKWKNDAYIDLNWSEELVYAIACTGHTMLDKEGNYETFIIERNSSKSETSQNKDCDCYIGNDRQCKKSDCNAQKSCDMAFYFPCNGILEK